MKTTFFFFFLRIDNIHLCQWSEEAKPTWGRIVAKTKQTQILTNGHTQLSAPIQFFFLSKAPINITPSEKNDILELY